MKPKRLQRSRRRGYRMPEGAVYCGRPTKWGNPFRASTYGDAKSTRAKQIAVHCFETWLNYPQQKELRAAMRRELRGKNLLCWCGLHDPCHVDIVLKVANS